MRDETEGPSLQRGECTFDFLSSSIADRTAELSELHDEQLRQLAQASYRPNTRLAAGKLVGSMLHRALVHQKIAVPAAFGGGLVQGEIVLIGQAKDFLLETYAHVALKCRPLYLRPHSGNSAAVDAILITSTVLCLIQSSLARWHSHVVETVFQILARLKTNKIEVDSLRLVYCMVGIDENHVKKLVCDARDNLTAIKSSYNTPELEKASRIALTRLNKLEVKGFMFDKEKALVLLS